MRDVCEAMDCFGEGKKQKRKEKETTEKALRRREVVGQTSAKISSNERKRTESIYKREIGLNRRITRLYICDMYGFDGGDDVMDG